MPFFHIEVFIESIFIRFGLKPHIIAASGSMPKPASDKSCLFYSVVSECVSCSITDITVIIQ